MALPRYIPWAVGGNYPAGSDPWDGRPLQVMPVYTYFTPGTPMTAQELNWLMANGMSGLATTVETALDNFYPLVAGTTINAGQSFEPLSVCFDKAQNSWYAHIWNGSTAGLIVQSITGGRTWNQIFSAGENSSVVAAAVNAGVVVYWTNNTTNQVTKFNGGFTNTTVPDSVVRNAGVAWWSDADSLFYLYLLENGGATFTSGTLVSTPNGTTLTQHTAPSGWGAATNHFGLLLHAQSPNFALVAMCGATAGTDTARLAKVTAGVMTDVTPALLSGRIITGLTYDASSTLFVMAAYDGTHTTVYQSADGVTWSSAVSTLTGRAGNGLRAVGGIWAMPMPPLNSFAAGGTYRIWISADQGTSWQETYSDIAGLTIGTTPNLLLSSGNGLLWVQTSSTPGAQASFSAGLTG